MMVVVVVVDWSRKYGAFLFLFFNLYGSPRAAYGGIICVLPFS